MTRVIALLSVLLFYYTAFAGPKTDSVTYHSADLNVSQFANLEIESSYFDEVENTLADIDARTIIINNTYGLVKLYFSPDAAMLPTSGKAELSLDLSYYVEDNGVLEEKSETVTLTIDMDAGIPMAYIKLNHALKVKGQITASTIPTSGFEDLNLEFRIESEVFTKMLYSEVVTGVNKDDQYLNSMGSLKVFWNPTIEAESYELEWTYISNQDTANANNTLPVNKINLRGMLFKTNSSRVEVTGTSYYIPLIYERGIICYRVRPVGRNITNGNLVTIKGAWSLDENYTNLGQVGANHYYPYDGLELNLNWQSSISFAEEGKNKVVLSYHDGSARNRQAVTRINSDERSVVGETFYDYNGRPVIQVLPVPTVENNLYYYPEFNKVGSDQGAAPIYKSSFDIATTGNNCEVLAPKLDTLSGAAGYYSGSNPFDTLGNKGNSIINRNLIPNAEQYPYTQTKYTGDNTGRIAAQSGVGKTHVLDSGQETKYLYGTPEQEELVRLFGNQVGSNAHYKKNMVIDPNGQVSVSYLDMDGKVIATALAGGSPENLDQLQGEKSRTIKSQLLNTVSNIASTDNLAKEYTKKIVVAENTTYAINYQFSSDPFVMQCMDQNGDPKPVSLSSVLNVEIQLLDCGQAIIDTVFSTNPQFGSGTKQAGGLDLDGINLKQGEYTLSKKVSINEARLKEYLDEYVNGSQYTCIIPISDYMHDSIAVSDISGCGYTCHDCQDNVEALIVTINTQRTTDNEALLSDLELETMRSKCYDLCRSNIACASALNGMLADVSIAGQYGEIREKNMDTPKIPSIDVDDFNDVGNVDTSEYDVPLNNDLDGNMMGEVNTDVQPGLFPLSVYNVSNILTVPPMVNVPEANWHYPVKVTGGICKDNLNLCLFKDELDLTDPEIQYVETDYFDTNGEMVYAKIRKIGEGQYFPEIRESGLTKVVIVNERIGEYKVPIKHLKDEAVFEIYWKTHFANYLVFYHPEFRYFVECTGQYDINEFEYQLVTTENLKDDVDHKFADANGNVTMIDNDPLFAIHPLLKKLFKLKYNNYKVVNGSALSMVQVANLGVNCPVESVICPNGDNCPSTKLDTANVAAWALFKSLYITERQEVIRKIATNKAINNEYYNGCIGDKDFRFEDDASEFFRFKAYNEEVTKQIKVCSGWWAWKNCHYETKTITNTRYAVPYFNSQQTCYIWRSRFYKDKTRIFYPQQYDLGGTLVQGRCTRSVFDPETGTNVEIEVNCQDDEEQYIQGVNNAKILQRYKECGLCPSTSDLQDFLVQVNRKNLLKSSAPIRLACPARDAQLLLGGSLTQEFKDGTKIPSISWKGVYNNGTRLLTGEIFSYEDGNEAARKKTITVTMDFSALPAGMDIDFSKLKICCLTPVSATEFKMRVYFHGVYSALLNKFEESLDYLPAGSLGDYKEASYEITGTVLNMPLTPCTIAPNCALTSTAKKIVGLLNTFNTVVINEKPKQLISSTTIHLDVDSLIYYYEYPLRDLIDMNGVNEHGDLLVSFESIDPTWFSTVSGNVLTGTLEYVGGDLDIIITKPSSLDFSHIDYFTNIQPVNDVGTCIANTCKLGSFTADAVVVDVNNKKNYTKVTITVPDYTMSVCEQVLPESN